MSLNLSRRASKAIKKTKDTMYNPNPIGDIFRKEEIYMGYHSPEEAYGMAVYAAKGPDGQVLKAKTSKKRVIGKKNNTYGSRDR